MLFSRILEFKTIQPWIESVRNIAIQLLIFFWHKQNTQQENEIMLSIRKQLLKLFTSKFDTFAFNHVFNVITWM